MLKEEIILGVDKLAMFSAKREQLHDYLSYFKVFHQSCEHCIRDTIPLYVCC
jgi:hypothetical protein